MSKYGHKPHNWFEAIVNKLGGEDTADRFLRGEIVIKMTERSFSIWKTVTLGAHKSPSAYCKALKANGYRIGGYANQILDKVKVSETETQLDLVVMSVADLGFKKGATRQQIYDRVIELGLELCPAEVGPALRLQYPDQPYGEWLRVAMEPIADSDGYLLVVVVVHDDGERWLGSDYDNPDFFCCAGFRWVFVAPRK